MPGLAEIDNDVYPLVSCFVQQLFRNFMRRIEFVPGVFARKYLVYQPAFTIVPICFYRHLL